MNDIKNFHKVIVVSMMIFFGFAVFCESTAWARAGRGGSMGSRGSRSFSSPRSPSSSPPSSPYSNPSPGYGSPGASPSTGGAFSRSPFMQGLAGGMAGGFLGSLLFGGMGHASGMGGGTGGGIGFLDIIILAALAYFGWKFFKRRKQLRSGTAYYPEDASQRNGGHLGTSQGGAAYDGGGTQEYTPAYDDVQRGFDQFRRSDPGFSGDKLKEEVQDIFFRIQAAWMNRALDGIEGLLTEEMTQTFQAEFDSMKKKGLINRLENIAIRKVEPAEVWQESGKDYITVLFTANLLDYTTDDTTGKVVSGDRLNPVKFREFWTFSRDTGAFPWRLSGIQQSDQS
ncbi:MAG: Tim44 domain-containing protein [Syntrophobacteraceae bacterium]